MKKFEIVVPNDWDVKSITDRLNEYYPYVTNVTVKEITQPEAKGRACFSHAPYGWMFDGYHLVPDKCEQKTINLVNELRNDGFGYRAIGVKLKELGYETRTGGDWNPQLIKRMLEG